MVFMTVSFLFRISCSFSYLSLMAAIWTSSSPPVRSFLYREMKGMVQPSSISAMVLATARSWMFSALAMSFAKIFFSMITFVNL